MVFKVSKGGVRSGNTLRALRSLKRYSRQGCIVSRSSLPPKEVKNILESSIEDEFISSTMGTLDVILSLNKKKRWLLPATVSHMLETGDFSDETTMVSLLERHKLKRKANCVRFVCNQGRIRHVTPENNKYFTFNLDNIGSDQSNREARRQKADVKNVQPIPAVKITRNKESGRMITVEAFTMLRSDNDNKKEVEKVKKIAITKPGYQLEVFYPCPQSCSLTFNPKYTNVHMENGEDGNMQVKANIKSSRAKRQHRKKFTLKDFDSLIDDMSVDFREEFWEEDYGDDDHFVSGDDQGVTDQDYNGCVGVPDNEAEDTRIHESINVLEYLISQAQKARALCENGKVHRRRIPSGTGYKDSSSLSEIEDKSHIIYIDKPEEGLQSPSINSQTQQMSSVNPQTQQTPSVNPQTQQIPSVNSQEPQTKIVLYPARVILLSAELFPENLRARFGNFYAESDSEPRRFVINVTEDVQNLLRSSGSAGENVQFTSFLVFIHDGFYDDGLDAFKVIFNSNICTDTLSISKSIPLQETSVAEIMNRVVCVLLDMKQENLIPALSKSSCEYLSRPMMHFVYDLLRVKVKSFHARDEISRAARTNTMQEKESSSDSFNKILRSFDSSTFCDICYENISPTQVGAVPFTQLSRCGHMFCDECWKSHFRASFKDGAVKMVCPGYECDVIVGPVTLLSLLHVSEVCQLFQRMCEDEAESSSNAKWCPKPDCGRVIRLESSDLCHDVTCACGHEFCFACLSEPHWPATCDQAAEYTEKLPALELPKETAEGLQSTSASPQKRPAQRKTFKPMAVEGRLCPKCSRFLEKNGGCQWMRCKCGHYFCWNCMKYYLDHAVCKPNPSYIFELSRRVKVNHIVIPKFRPTVTPQQTMAVTEESKTHQKETMRKKALLQRVDANEDMHSNLIRKIADRVARVAQRDLLLKRELLSLLGAENNHADEASLARVSLVPHLIKFIRSCHDIKRALHHVAEFTFVLLQGTPDCVDKRRVHRLANDINAYCSFIKSILELGQNQDIRTAVKRLVDIQVWARRALVVHISSVNKLRRYVH